MDLHLFLSRGASNGELVCTDLVWHTCYGGNKINGCGQLGLLHGSVKLVSAKEANTRPHVSPVPTRVGLLSALLRLVIDKLEQNLVSS
jgi:hypothetical protein